MVLNGCCERESYVSLGGGHLIFIASYRETYFCSNGDGLNRKKSVFYIL